MVVYCLFDKNDKLLFIGSTKDVAEKEVERRKGLPSLRKIEGEYSIGPWKVQDSAIGSK